MKARRNNEEVEQMFVKINHAYEVLSDVDKRRRYDRRRTQAYYQDFDIGERSTQGMPFSMNDDVFGQTFMFHDPFQIFDHFFASQAASSMFPTSMSGHSFRGNNRSDGNMFSPFMQASIFSADPMFDPFFESDPFFTAFQGSNSRFMPMPSLNDQSWSSSSWCYTTSASPSAVNRFQHVRYPSPAGHVSHTRNASHASQPANSSSSSVQSNFQASSSQEGSSRQRRSGPPSSAKRIYF